MEKILITILVLILLFLIIALPLHLAVRFMGGRTTILKSFLVVVLTGVLSALIYANFKYGGIIAFLLLIWIYREMFRLKWIKAVLVWVIEIVLIVIFTAIFAILGIGVLTFSLF